MKTRILFLFLFLICLRAFPQQQILYQDTQQKSYMLSYNNMPADESQRVINEFLEAIATFVPKHVSQTKITFNIEERIKITRLKNVVSIFVTHQSGYFNGDYFYKGFDMSDVIIPSKYEFSGTLSRSKGLFLADFVQPRTDFKLPYSEVVLQYNDTATSNQYIFVINNTTYYYDNTTRNRFREKASMVDQYFIADGDLNNINNALNQINPDEFENIDKIQGMMNDYNRNIDNISKAAFWQALRIETNDPVKLYSKLYSVRSHYQSLQDQVNKTLSIIHELYYNKALSYYNNNRKADARYNFERSLSYYAQYSPSQYYLALISFEEKQYENAKQDLLKLFTFKTIDQLTLNAAMSLAKSLEWTDINQAAGLLNKGLFNDALKALDPAEQFCTNIPNYKCSDTIELIRGDCHRGIYGQSMQKADQLFAQGQLDAAEAEINKALDYQKQQQKYIPDANVALGIKQKIMIEQYYAAMKKGKDKMAAKDYRAAFAEFEKAKDIESYYPVKKDAKLPGLIKSSKLEVLFLDLNIAESQVGHNDLLAARKLLTQVIEEQRTYELIDNSGLNQKIENLKKSIFTQECKNAQSDYDEQIRKAAGLVNEKKFIEAEATYNAAEVIVVEKNDCEIDDHLAKEGLNYVKYPAEYQRMLNDCNNMIDRVLYQDALKMYTKLSDFYLQHKLGESGIEHKSLHEFIASHESGFVLYSVDYLANAGEYDNAFYLLKQLMQRNYKKQHTKNQQKSLGRMLAIRDMHLNAGMNPKTQVLEYTSGDKWYKYLSSAYIKQAKQMKK